MLPESLIIETTNYCNAQCLTCTNRFMKRPKEFIDLGLFEYIISKIKGTSILNLNLQMHGEAFMHPKIYKIIEIIRKECSEKKILLISNGELIEEFPDCDHIDISFNAGAKETYEKLMYPLKFEKMIEKIKSFEKFKDKITIHFVVSKDNEAEIPEFEKLWEGWIKGYNYFYNTWNQNIEDRGTKQDYKMIPCDMLYKVVTIQVNGNIGLCCNDYEGVNILGNIKTNSIEDIFTNKMEEYRKAQEQGQRIGLCKTCNYNYERI